MHKLAAKHERLWAQGLWIGVLVYALDQLSKWWLIDLIQASPEPVMEVTGFFNLLLTWNTGVSFSMFRELGARGHWPLTLITGVITLILLRWQFRSRSRAVVWPLGLVIGGALGNITDRVRFGAVADFFDLHVAGYHWPAFNVADMAIVAGVMLLIWDNLREGWRQDSRREAEAKEANETHEP